MSLNFLKSVRNSSVFSLICEGRYDEAAQALEQQLSKNTNFNNTFEACLSVLLVSDQFDRMERVIESFEQALLQNKRTVGLSAAILQLLERSDKAEIYSQKFEELGGTPPEFQSISAYVAQTSGRPDLHMEHLFKRAFMPDVDQDKALLKYMRVCLQYGEIDRAEKIRELLNEQTRLGQYAEAIFEALLGDRSGLITRVKEWVSAPNSDARYSVLIEALWNEAGVPELYDSMRQSSERWHDDPSAFAGALRHHFVRLNGSQPNGAPVVERLKVEESNFPSVALALIDHGYLRNASDLIDTLDPLNAEPSRSFGASLKNLISSIRSLDTRRKIIVDRPDMDWLLSEPADPKKVCIVFTGLNGQVGVGGLRILDRFLGSLGYQVLYVRDFSRLAFANGITSRGRDKATSIDALRRFIEESGSDDPVIIGVSRGSAAAIEYGLQLKARRILTFGYQGWKNTNERWRIGDARAALFNARYHQQKAKQTEGLEDHMASANHEFQIDMFYQRLNLVDAYHARTLRTSDRLNLHPLNGSRSHSCLQTLMMSDGLKHYL